MVVLRFVYFAKRLEGV